MSGRNRKKERILAWVVVLIVFIILSVALVATYFVVKDPIKNIISSYFSKPEVVEEEIPEEEPEETTLGEAISEESLEEIFGEDEPEEEVEEPEEIVEEDVYLIEAENIVNDMTIEQKVGQMFFVSPESITGVDVATAAGEKTRASLETYPVGGIILSSQNVEDPEQLKEMTSNFQKYSMERLSVPMFIGVDEEGGRVLRIAGKEGFDIEETKSMAELGESGDTQKAGEAGEYIGTYLKEYGVNVDFAPDVDVITESENKVIGDRSFGNDPQLVADMSVAYYDGLRNAGIIGCPKHFPNHGATKEDSHDGQAVSDRSWDTLIAEDLLPFSRLIDDGANFIMVSHISVPEVTGDDIPASLSAILLTQKLRLEMGYNGVIITDSMNMGAITSKYESDKAAIEAIKAGADIILTPKDIDKAYNGVINAVSEGEISEERINESVVRIVKAKLTINSENVEEELSEN